MRKNILTILQCTLVAVFVLTTASVGSAATNSNAPTIALTAAVAESLTVSLGGTTQNWPSLTPGNATNASASGTITATTSWVLQPGRSAVKLYAFFGSTVALSAATPPASGGVNIPTSAFEISVDGGGNTPVTQDNSGAGIGVAGASLLLKSVTITGANKVSSTAPVLGFNINLSSGAMQQLPADSYSGTLTIMAQATP